jgi:tocopherol O-methyltransferase
MTTYNKEKIIKHYDVVSPYYHSLWGEHLHHGYWVSGKETKEEAQLALTKHLALVSDIKPGSRILDVGCGFGASSIYLAKNYNAETIGITISPVQVKMAQEASKIANANSCFMLMDAEAMSLDKQFDVIWSIESISHYKNKEEFFSKACQLLFPEGTIAVIDWFKKENLTANDNKKYILPIEKGMMVGLHTMGDYISTLKLNGLEIIKSEDISRNVAKTWDITLEIIKDKKFWLLALKHGWEFINFLRSFQAMKKGFASGNFVYGLIVAKKVKCAN